MIKNYLQSKGIQLEIRNHLLPQIAGEIPAGDCWPSLWSKTDEEHEKATELIQDYRRLTESESFDKWLCGCGETIEGEYGECWSLRRHHLRRTSWGGSFLRLRQQMRHTDQLIRIAAGALGYHCN